MQQFGGIDSKRHFTVVMGDKEHGLYVSSTPSSAAKKAVTKLCAKNKGKKVEFSMREITQGSKKKTYGPYLGYIEKLKDPIELKGRIIKHKSVIKLQEKEGGQFFSGIFEKKKEITEFNRNATGQLTSNAKNKMLENFHQPGNSTYNIRINEHNTDTFYFGSKNIIDFKEYYQNLETRIVGKKFYPFSIYNIVHNSQIQDINRVLKFRILMFDSIKYGKLLKQLEEIKPNTEQYFVYYGQTNLTKVSGDIINKEFIFLEFNLMFYYKLLDSLYNYAILILDNSSTMKDLLSRNFDNESYFLRTSNKRKHESGKDSSNVYQKFRSFRDFYYKECFELINNIYENLESDPTQIVSIQTYNYKETIYSFWKEIRHHTHKFRVHVSEIPQQIYHIYKKKQQELRNKLKKEEEEQKIYNREKAEKLAEFRIKLDTLCPKGAQPVEYIASGQFKNKCELQSIFPGRCYGCKEITGLGQFSNSIQQGVGTLQQGVGTLQQGVEKAINAVTSKFSTVETPRIQLPNSRQVQNTIVNGIRAPFLGAKQAVTSIADTAEKAFKVGSLFGNRVGNEISKSARKHFFNISNWLTKK